MREPGNLPTLPACLTHRTCVLCGSRVARCRARCQRLSAPRGQSRVGSCRDELKLSALCVHPLHTARALTVPTVRTVQPGLYSIHQPEEVPSPRARSSHALGRRPTPAVVACPRAPTHPTANSQQLTGITVCSSAHCSLRTCTHPTLRHTISHQSESHLHT
jgi:hypothetical protein